MERVTTLTPGESMCHLPTYLTSQLHSSVLWVPASILPLRSSVLCGRAEAALMQCSDKHSLLEMYYAQNINKEPSNDESTTQDYSRKHKSNTNISGI